MYSRYVECSPEIYMAWQDDAILIYDKEQQEYNSRVTARAVFTRR